MRVVAAPGRVAARAPPVQPTPGALRALLPSTTVVQPRRLYQDTARDALREWGVVQITPERHPAEWKQPSQEAAPEHVALVGCTIHEAHLAAAAVLVACDAAQRVTALIHVQGAARPPPPWRC